MSSYLEMRDRYFSANTNNQLPRLKANTNIMTVNLAFLYFKKVFNLQFMHIWW